MFFFPPARIPRLNSGAAPLFSYRDPRGTQNACPRGFRHEAFRAFFPVLASLCATTLRADADKPDVTAWRRPSTAPWTGRCRPTRSCPRRRPTTPSSSAASISTSPGVIPSGEKSAAFLDSTDPDKRAKLIDELLASPAYGRHMADIWQGLLVQADSNNRRVTFEPLHGWLEKGFNENRPGTSSSRSW